METGGATPLDELHKEGCDSMNKYRLDVMDDVGYLRLGSVYSYADDKTAKKSLQPLADYWKQHRFKVIISRVLDNGVCLTI